MRLTIITPTLNRAHFLEEAIASVRSQALPGTEHLILDGGSTDGTRELLARHPHLRVISEPDRGLYDAVNKGFRLATGDVIGWLNSDDRLAPGALAAVASAFSDPAIEAVCGGVEMFETAGGSERRLHRLSTAEELALTVRNVTLGIPAVNARFFRRAFRERLGDCDLRYRIAADREWLLRAALLAPRESVLAEPVYHYRQHGDSMTLDRAGQNATRYRQEHLAIAEEYLRRDDLLEETRATLRRWHTRESSAEVHAAVWRRDWPALLSNARRGWRLAAGWPFACVSTGVRGLLERAGRGRNS